LRPLVTPRWVQAEGPACQRRGRRVVRVLRMQARVPSLRRVGWRHSRTTKVKPDQGERPMLARALQVAMSSTASYRRAEADKAVECQKPTRLRRSTKPTEAVAPKNFRSSTANAVFRAGLAHTGHPRLVLAAPEQPARTVGGREGRRFASSQLIPARKISYRGVTAQRLWRSACSHRARSALVISFTMANGLASLHLYRHRNARSSRPTKELCAPRIRLQLADTSDVCSRMRK